MSGVQAGYSLSDERLITTEGTISPQAVRFENGKMLVCYHVGNDAYFSSFGAHRSRDDGETWEPVECPLNRATAMGEVAQGRAILFDQYLWKVGRDEYAVFMNQTLDAGETFTGPELATFHLKGAIDHHYLPRDEADPDYFYEPKVPAFYESVTGKHGSTIGGHVFGRVVRLADGALCVAAYTKMEGNETRLKEPGHYVKPRKDGTAPEAREDVLDSSLLFVSNDEGRNWEHASTIGRIRPGTPFDGGKIFSEGFNETGLSLTSDGKLYALMRHGSYMLLWRAISEDDGRTWGDLRAFNYPGVAPSLSLLPNGVLAAVWGRPGLSVGFSLDGTGTNWDLLVGIMHDGVPSQKYGWLVATGRNRLMLFYDRREWDSERRRFFNHGIYCRTIEVEPGHRQWASRAFE